MGGIVGAMGKLRIGTENAFGSGGYVGGWLDIPFTAEDLKLENGIIFPDEARDDYMQQVDESGNLNARGSFSFGVNPDNKTIITTWALARTSSVLTNSLAIRVDRKKEVVRYRGCYIDTLTLACGGTDQRLIAAVGIEGRDEIADVDWDESFSAKSAFHFSHGVFSIGGATESLIRSMSVTVANNSDTETYGVDHKLVEIPQQKRLVTGSLICTMSGATYTAAFRAGDDLAFEVVFTHPDASTLTITVPKMVLTGTPVSVDPAAIIAVPINFQAKKYPLDATGYEIAIT